MIRKILTALVLALISAAAVAGLSGSGDFFASSDAPLAAAAATAAAGALGGYLGGKKIRWHILPGAIFAAMSWLAVEPFSGLAAAGASIGFLAGLREKVSPRVLDGMFAGVLAGTLLLFAAGAPPRSEPHGIRCCGDGMVPALLQNPRPAGDIMFIGPADDDLVGLLRESMPSHLYLLGSTRGAVPGDVRHCGTVFYCVYRHGEVPGDPEYVRRLAAALAPDAVLIAPAEMLQHAGLRMVRLSGRSRLGASSRAAKLTCDAAELEKRLAVFNERLEMPLLPSGMLHLLPRCAPLKAQVAPGTRGETVRHAGRARPEGAIWLYLALFGYAGTRLYLGRSAAWSARFAAGETGAAAALAVLGIERIIAASPGTEGLLPAALTGLLALLFREIPGPKPYGRLTWYLASALLVLAGVFLAGGELLIFECAALLIFLAAATERDRPATERRVECTVAGIGAGCVFSAWFAVAEVPPAMTLFMLFLL